MTKAPMIYGGVQKTDTIHMNPSQSILTHQPRQQFIMLTTVLMIEDLQQAESIVKILIATGLELLTQAYFIHTTRIVIGIQ